MSNMDKYQNLPFHPAMEDVVNVLMEKTQNKDPLFFRIITTYFFAKLASMMRTYINIPGTGVIPVNMYGIALANSGSGKGHSINIIEDDLIQRFKQKFISETLPSVASKQVAVQANKRAAKNNTDPDDELMRAQKEFEELGPMPFSFDSGTTAAVKQMRHKLLLCNAGSMNMEIDEISNNLLGNVDVLSSFLELFDMGKIKQKLTKNTKENTRFEEIDGHTPANLLLFGTPVKLLDGAKVEDEFYAMLETGYSRRCFFGFSKNGLAFEETTAEELLKTFMNTTSADILVDMSEKLVALADEVNFANTFPMDEETALYWLEYQLDCKRESKKLSSYEDIRKNELIHRYFKVAKVAAAYAFIDQVPVVGIKHVQYAIALAEQSGQAFEKLLHRERAHVKLASYIASIGRDVSQADLIEDLPFYKGTEMQKREMMSLAVSHGYTNNMIIKRYTLDEIEFFSGSSIESSDPSDTIISYSTDIVSGYKNDNVDFDQLDGLTQLKGYHFVNCHLKDESGTGGYRDEKHSIPRINMVVIDVDGGTSIDTAKLLLADYKYLIYTTKRHDPANHRFRIMIPLSHYIELEGSEYKEFMNNIYAWLPFEVDTATNQLSRKWLTNVGDHWFNTDSDEVLDALQFIPRSKVAEKQKQFNNKFGSLSNLERWFVSKTEQGGRNNMLIRYAYCLIDMGKSLEDIRDRVLSLNSKLESPLQETEVLSTVIVSASKKLLSNNP